MRGGWRKRRKRERKDGEGKALSFFFPCFPLLIFLPRSLQFCDHLKIKERGVDSALLTEKKLSSFFCNKRKKREKREKEREREKQELAR